MNCYACGRPTWPYAHGIATCKLGHHALEDGTPIEVVPFGEAPPHLPEARKVSISGPPAPPVRRSWLDRLLRRGGA